MYEVYGRDCIECQILLYNIKELDQPGMDTPSGTPVGQPITLDFNGKILYIVEPAPNKVSINFDELAENSRYEVKEHTLEKINYKTIVAALKGTHPNIINARLSRHHQEGYELAVSVNYEFLPQVVELMKFESKEIPAEESDQIAIRNMRITLRSLRDQISALGNIEVRTGELDEQGDTEIYQPLVHKTTVFTWSVTYSNFQGGNVYPQMFYFNSATKQRKTSGAIPEEGLTLHHTGEGVNFQVKFLGELEDYDMVMFKLKGKNKGQYMLTSEKVDQL